MLLIAASVPMAAWAIASLSNMLQATTWTR